MEYLVVLEKAENWAAYSPDATGRVATGRTPGGNNKKTRESSSNAPSGSSGRRTASSQGGHGGVVRACPTKNEQFPPGPGFSTTIKGDSLVFRLRLKPWLPTDAYQMPRIRRGAQSCLIEYRFIINSRGVASVSLDDASTVEGLFWPLGVRRSRSRATTSGSQKFDKRPGCPAIPIPPIIRGRLANHLSL